jgi:hypothetical protein
MIATFPRHIEKSTAISNSECDTVDITGSPTTYWYCKNDPINRVDPTGLRDVSTGEDAILKHLDSISEYMANPVTVGPKKYIVHKDPTTSKQFADLAKALRAEIEAIPVGAKDPVALAIRLEALKQWHDQTPLSDMNNWADKGKGIDPSGTYDDIGNGSEDPSLNPKTAIKGAIDYTLPSPLVTIPGINKCSSALASILTSAIGIKLPTHSTIGKPWAKFGPDANAWATGQVAKDISAAKGAFSPIFSQIEKKALLPGDILGYAATGEHGHVGIYLGFGLYISARSSVESEVVPGEPYLQPSSGLQIKSVDAMGQDKGFNCTRF